MSLIHHTICYVLFIFAVVCCPSVIYQLAALIYVCLSVTSRTFAYVECDAFTWTTWSAVNGVLIQLLSAAVKLALEELP